MESIKILWIDDDINRQVLKPYIDEFEENGFAIIGVANPDEIENKLNLMQNLKCIILDISMPYGTKIDPVEAKQGIKTGLIVLQQLVNNLSLKNIKKVVFTITDNDEVRDYCDKNVIDYLEKKSFMAGTFVDRIKKIISDSDRIVY
ncbi:hypothetical protein EZS27_016400 [termite gut metagenome]|uniref:Response regulatory domain-containing protein n=1 Tax=termite gut metagenome TaxID=433724 RepID=A0A5J4RPD8_9ZZZZ